MRMLLAATCSAGVAVVVASPATAGAPPPRVPPGAAIAQYIEAVPSATGLVPVGARATTAHAAALPPAVRANVEQTGGADAPLLINIAEDARFGARPMAPATSAPAGSATPARPAHARTRTAHAVPRQPAASPTGTPGALGAAASTARSGGFLLVALLLVAITAAGIASRLGRR